jgi:hypothetical protein
MRVVSDNTKLQPVISASSSLTGYSPELAIDNDGTTQWVSGTSDTTPYLQLDLGKIIRVYRIEIDFSNSNPASAPGTRTGQYGYLLSTDNPNDTNYGLSQLSGKSAWDTVASFTAPTFSGNTGTVVVQLPVAKAGRYWQIYWPNAVGAGQSLGIWEVRMYADTVVSETSSRADINGVMFTDQTNDLLEVVVQEQISKAISSATLKLNNKNSKWLSTQFPSGSVCRVWIDGVQKLYGTLIEFIPTYDTSGWVIDVTIHDWADSLVNNTLYQAWVATPIADNTKTNDIIAQGPNSILGMTLNSVGARVINSNGVLQAAGGANTVFYLKANNEAAWTTLQKLGAAALDGDWIIQNPGFDQGNVNTSTIGAGLSDTDGRWFSDVTSTSFKATVRDNGAGYPAPSALLDTTAVSAGGAIVSTLTNFHVPTVNYLGQLNIGQASLTYDGNFNNDTRYLYAEIFQPVLTSVSDLNQEGSLSAMAFFGPILTVDPNSTGTPSSYSQIFDFIVECSPSPGLSRRMHYLFGDKGYQGQIGASFPPPTTPYDAYFSPSLSAGGQTYFYADGTISNSSPSGVAEYLSTNFYADYAQVFGTIQANSDTVVSIRVRSIPFQDISGAEQQYTQKVWIDNVIMRTTGKVPPVQYDFNVTTDSNGNATLNWFPRPRPGVDLGYRHLDSSNNLYLYSIFPESDLNNINQFKFTKSDIYRTKTDIVLRGQQARAAQDGVRIDASLITSDQTYLGGVSPPHGSAFPVVEVQDQLNMGLFGRRMVQATDRSTNVLDLSRNAIAKFNQTQSPEQRGIITCKGNANLTPGYCVYIGSDSPDIAGWYYIQSTEHRWDKSGYITTVTLEDDRFRFANEFSRIQADASVVLAGSASPLKVKTYSKIGANVAGATYNSQSLGNISGHTWQYTQDQDVIRLPYNFIPELSAITHLTVTTTRLSGLEAYGGQGPSDYIIGVAGTFSAATGWDQNVPVKTFGANADEITLSLAPSGINTVSQVAQRFVMPNSSSGRLLFQLVGRIDSTTSVASNVYLNAAIVADSASPNTGQAPTAQSLLTPGSTIPTLSWIGGEVLNLGGLIHVGGPTPAPTQGGWKQIPFNKLGVTSSKFSWTGIFIEMEAPVGSQGFAPGQAYWLVITPSSVGYNFHLGGYHNAAPANEYALSQLYNNSAWGPLFGGDGQTSDVLYCQFWTQQALTSAGGVGLGTGNKLTIWDPYTGNAENSYVPTPGADQQFGLIDFPTYVLARKNSIGQVDVSFPMSVGGSTGPPSGVLSDSTLTNNYRSYGRHDYAARIVYIE